MKQSDIDRISWYHAIELEPGLVTPGRFEQAVPPNFTLFPVFQFLEHIDLNGLDCLDIGTTDGLASFIMRMKGGRVVATDRGEREGFYLVREHLGLKDVEYLPKTTLDGGDLESKLARQKLPSVYDLVLLSGVIYHAYDPLVVMMYARKLLKPEGLLIVETVRHPGSDSALYTNWDAPRPVIEPNTYFLPTLKAVHSMLRFCCCDPIATVINGNRVGVLMIAKPPRTFFKQNHMLEMIFSRSLCYGPLDFSELDKEASKKSEIRYTGRTEEWEIDMETFHTNLPLQPKHQSRGSYINRLKSMRRRLLRPLCD